MKGLLINMTLFPLPSRNSQLGENAFTRSQIKFSIKTFDFSDLPTSPYRATTNYDFGGWNISVWDVTSCVVLEKLRCYERGVRLVLPAKSNIKKNHAN